jgi:zinc/manganese transport system substrate-binding protein
MNSRHSPGTAVIVAIAFAALLLAACASGGSTGPVATIAPGAKIQVVAAENFWGSIASQVGGDHVTVNSIISNPDTDPHDYEPTAADGLAVARAQYVVFNGVGYDPWVDKLLAANPVKGRLTLKVQDVLGLKADDNPHRWYSPDDVAKVIERLNADYKKIDPTDGANLDQQKSDFLSNGLKQYNGLVQQIKQQYAGTPVGATESIMVPLASALGLKLISPAGFMQAMSEGSDPTSSDKATFDTQIQQKQIKVLFFNTQNSTPDVQRLVDAAKAQGIPVVEVTETLTPENATFQDWQSQELKSLADALAKATGK